VKTIVTTKKQAPARPLSRADLAILLSVERFHYLTASQVSRLLYPNSHDHHRYARRRLAWLAAHHYLLRLSGLPTPWSGSAPHVFTLGREGRVVLAATQTYFRPAEEQDKVRNAWFMTHTLATIDVLIAAELLGRSHPVAMPRLLTERQLRGNPLRVRVPAGGDGQARSVAVIPDAWFELSVAGRKPVGIAVELDQATEYQQRWRGKVAALSAWATGPYRHAFANPSLTIAVVTPEADRRDRLRDWTAQELARIGQPELAEIFLFTDASPVATPPEAFFFGRVWYEPATHDPVSLLTPQPPTANVIPLPGREVWRGGG
jgi:hypothetical protein